MVKCKKLQKIFLLSILIFLLSISVLSGRVVASDTITLYGYIAAKTSVLVNQAGEIFFTSNEPTALLDVREWRDATLLSVTAL